MNLKDLNMSIGEMLKYREILSEKSGQSKTIGQPKNVEPYNDENGSDRYVD